MAGHLNSEAIHLKSDENQERANRREYEYSMSASESDYEADNEAMPANSSEREGDSNLTTESSGESSGLRNMPDIPARAPKRPKSRGRRRKTKRPKLSKLNELKGPHPKVNMRMRIPGTHNMSYRRDNKTYEFPMGIEPWTAEGRWMLEPESGIFKQDPTFHYRP